MLVESGGDHLAASFSPELMDLCIYVIDVAAGDRIPRKGNERPWCFTNLHTGEGVEDFLLHQLPLRYPSPQETLPKHYHGLLTVLLLGVYVAQ